MKPEDLCECKHRAELVALRQRVEDQRKELARLNSLVEELRSTFIRQSGACRSAIYRTISDLALSSRLMEHAEKDFASQNTAEHPEKEKAG